MHPARRVKPTAAGAVGIPERAACNIAVVHLDPSSSVGPLAGVRVLELGNFIAGPVRRSAAR